MPDRACRPAERRAVQSAECEDHQEGRSFGGASAGSHPLVGAHIVRCLEARKAEEGRQRTGPGPVAEVDHHIAVHPADLAGPEEDTAVAADRQAQADRRDRTGEHPVKQLR